MIVFLRILLVFVVALFWGGLTFYTGFVVRISHALLDNPMDGGLITQQVTVVLQWLAAISVVLMAINGFVIRRRHSMLGTALLVCTSILACSVVGLFFVHQYLDSVIDVAAREITDYEAFDARHRYYNQFTTIEWLATVVYLALNVVAWKTIDSSIAKSPAAKSPAVNSQTLEKPVESPTSD